MMVLLTICLTLTLTLASAVPNGLKAEVYGNSVMRGTPKCVTTLPNGFSKSMDSLCDGVAAEHVGIPSIRLTGTLTPPAAAATWYNFSAVVGEKAFTCAATAVVDNHELQWLIIMELKSQTPPSQSPH